VKAEMVRDMLTGVAESMEPAVCLGRDMDCGRPLPCPDHPAVPTSMTTAPTVVKPVVK
jgi:hypothetical protein